MRASADASCTASSSRPRYQLTFDLCCEFCQAVYMHLPFRQFIAVLLAIWLPLFSGNALAASIAMQTNGGNCHGVQPGITQSDIAQPGAYHANHVSSMHQHMQLAADQPAGHQEQQNHQHDHPNPSHKNCAVCQLACSGYMAAVTVEVAGIQLPTQAYTPLSTQFQSHTSAPLDPPPLARV